MLDRDRVSRLESDLARLTQQVACLPVRIPLVGGGGGGGGTSTPVDIKIVLIEDDIEGVEFDDPQVLLTEDDIESDGLEVVFQDPPDDDLGENVQEDGLNVWPYGRRLLKLKYFYQPTKTVITSGVVQDGTSTTVELEAGASADNDEYNGLRIAIESETHGREVRSISDYAGTGRTVTVGDAFDHAPDDSGDFTYSIERWEPGYEEDEDGEPLKKLRLKTTTTDIGDDPPVRVVRYATTNVYYDDQEGLKLGYYGKVDYPDYDENASWPPSGMSATDPFFKRKAMGIAVNGVLMTAFCNYLPAPQLPS